MQDKERIDRNMEMKTTPEKRLALARYIREENMGNRVKLRQRENILYGRDLHLPPDEKSLFSDAAITGGVQGEDNPSGISTGSFKYRMTLAVLLFVGFLLCDTKQSRILTFDTNQIYEMIRSDSLHLNESDDNVVMEQLAEFFD